MAKRTNYKLSEHMKTLLITLLILLAGTSFASGTNKPVYQVDKVYTLNDGRQWLFLGYKDNGAKLFQGFKRILPKYHGQSKRLQKKNNKLNRKFK